MTMYEINTSNVTVMVSNMNRSVDFYTSLGLQLKNRWGDHYAIVEAPGVSIGLHPAEKIHHSVSVSVGFGIADLGIAKNKLEELQIPYEQEEGKSGNFLHFKDPDGFILYFMQSKIGEW
jgi:catechol 2,3-dioxygenase-like lactoylglutathione lyase family enzyme